jgi:hypothetical protein
MNVNVINVMSNSGSGKRCKEGLRCTLGGIHLSRRCHKMVTPLQTSAPSLIAAHTFASSLSCMYLSNCSIGGTCYHHGNKPHHVL